MVGKVITKKPFGTAVRFRKYGTVADVVYVSFIDDDKQIVSFCTAHYGAGSCMGSWPNGFVSGSLAQPNEIAYFCNKFGFDKDAFPRSLLTELNEMYLSARDEMVKKMAIDFMSIGRNGKRAAVVGRNVKCL